MTSPFYPHHSSSSFLDNTRSAAAEAYIPGYIPMPAIVRDHAPSLHGQDMLCTGQLSTIPLWTLPTPEDYPAAYDVPYATHNCYVPDGLSSAGLISQMLHPYYAQWVGLGNIPLETVTEMTAPTSLLSSSSLPSWPHDRVHSLPTATSENIGRRIAVLVSQLVTQSIHGLEDIDFVLQVIRWVVTFVADDNFSREYYFKLTVNHLYPFRTSWNGLYHTPFPAAVEIATPLPSLSTQSTSPPPQEAVHVPATPNDVSSNETTQRFACDYCNRTFSRVDSLNRHLDETCTYTTKKQHCTNTKKERSFMNTFSARK